MAKYVFTESQLKKIQEGLLKETKTNTEIKEGKDGNYMAKQQLFTIATLAMSMWEIMEYDAQLDDWMETKIAQAEQSITAVVKSHMYDDIEGQMRGSNDIDFDDLIIGR